LKYNGHDRNSPLDGPIARRLKEYGRVKAFVVDPRAEMSSDVHSLINCISERAAEVRWRGMLATDVIHAKGYGAIGSPSRRTGGGRVRSRVIE